MLQSKAYVQFNDTAPAKRCGESWRSARSGPATGHNWGLCITLQRSRWRNYFKLPNRRASSATPKKAWLIVKFRLFINTFNKKFGRFLSPELERFDR